MDNRSSSASGPFTEIAVIGAGPRGVVVVERLVAAARSHEFHGRLRVHLIDPFVHTGGSVWRSDQPRTLLMNTLTCQTTMYPDDSCSPRFPAPEGALTFDQFLTDYERWEFAPRAEHGRYIAHVLHKAIADAPEHVEIQLYEGEVRDLEREDDDRQTLRIRTPSGDASIRADQVILALGHLRTEVSVRGRSFQNFAAENDLAFAPPENPLDVDYAQFLDRERIAVQGMGLNFYDVIGMLTEAAGGRFVPDESVPHRLRYEPSGREPVLVVGSRTGMVYRPKPDISPEIPEPFELRVLTDERVAQLSATLQGLDYEADVLPLMMQELQEAISTGGYEPPRVEDMERELFPLGRRSVSLDDAHDQTVAELRRATERSLPEADGRWLLLFRVLVALKGQINELARRGAFTAGSFLRDVDGFLRNALASWTSGPPVLRGQQLLALVDAGLVEFTGPGMSIGLDHAAGRFTVRAGDGPVTLCDGVLLAHLPPVQLDAFTSPLIRSLKRRGEITPARLPLPQPDEAPPTGSIDLADDFHPVTVHGHADDDRLFLGVPVSTAQPGSSITAAPGSGAQLLRFAEAAVILALTAEGNLL